MANEIEKRKEKMPLFKIEFRIIEKNKMRSIYQKMLFMHRCSNETQNTVF